MQLPDELNYKRQDPEDEYIQKMQNYSSQDIIGVLESISSVSLISAAAANVMEREWETGMKDEKKRNFLLVQWIGMRFQGMLVKKMTSPRQ